MIYAQLNDDNICVAISNLPGEINQPNMILVTDNADHLNQRYNDGIWEELPIPDIDVSEMSDVELAIYDSQANIEYLVAMSELGGE